MALIAAIAALGAVLPVQAATAAPVETQATKKWVGVYGSMAQCRGKYGDAGDPRPTADPCREYKNYKNWQDGFYYSVWV